jgi:O-antigen/teichoic acid export membrane protein
MRQLSGQSLVYGLSGALAKLVALVIVPILIHILVPRDYGVIDQITSFSALIGAFLILGSDAAVAFYYYREQNEDGRRALLSTWLIFELVLNTVAGAVLFALARPLTNLLLGGISQSDFYLKIVAVVLPLSATISYVLEVLRLQMRPGRYLFISATNVLSGMVLTLALVVWLRLGLEGVYIGSACTNVIAFVLAAITIRGSVGVTFSIERLRALLAYGVPLVPITVASWAIGLSSRFFIKAHSGLSDVGLFAAGNKVAQIMLLVVTAFTLAWGPFAFSIAQEHTARRTYAKVLTFYAAGVGGLALALTLYAPLILRFAAAPVYARAYQVVAPLALYYAVLGAYSIVAVGTSLSKKTIHLSWTTISAALVTLILNAVLVPLPYMALVGGALAMLIGQCLSVGLVYGVSQRLYPIPYERGKLLICLAVLGILVVLGQIAHGWYEPYSIPGVLVPLLLLSLYPMLLLAFRVIERYEVVVVWAAFRTRLRMGGRRP